MMEKLKNSYLARNDKLIQPKWKTIWQFLKLLGIDLPYDAAVLLLGVHRKEMKTYVQKIPCTQIFVLALFEMSRTGERLIMITS